MLTDFGVNRAALAFGPGSPAEDVLQLGYTICYAATGRAPWPGLAAGPIPPDAATAPPGDRPDRLPGLCWRGSCSRAWRPTRRGGRPPSG